MNEIENVFTSTVIQSRMSAVWFKDKELAFSFGCILAFSRLVSYKTNDYWSYMRYQDSLTTDGFAKLCIFGPQKMCLIHFRQVGWTSFWQRALKKSMICTGRYGEVE